MTIFTCPGFCRDSGHQASIWPECCRGFLLRGSDCLRWAKTTHCHPVSRSVRFGNN